MVQGAQLAKEEFQPDRPGQLPLMHVAGILDPRNPLYENREKIETGQMLRDPAKMAAADRQKLDKTLDELFGTPAKPIVRGYEPGDNDTGKVIDLPSEMQTMLKLDPATLEQGSKLYRVHCVHCHGVAGDGRGPTAQWVNPHPRDFRQGIFKFQSVDQLKAGANAPPRRQDLLRTLEFGLEASAMPAFTLLTDAEREALVSYVIHLSLRGNAEFATIKDGFTLDKQKNVLVPSDNVPGPDVFPGVMHAINLQKWLKSQQSEYAIVVPPSPIDPSNLEELRKSVQRGHQMFTGKADADASKQMQDWVKATNCVSCHTDYGRQATFRWDDWGTLVRPNNLTNGIYRGGRRPVDIFYRVHSGINGSGMARFGENLPPAALWDLVNFVRTMPYASMRQSLAINIP
jgi:mono/diheme cytochrome c family protein